MNTNLLEIIDNLKPCPFCGLISNEGANTHIDIKRVWCGVKYTEPLSVSIIHHCPPIPGQPNRRIERIGKDLESAIKAWDMRK